MFWKCSVISVKICLRLNQCGAKPILTQSQSKSSWEVARNMYHHHHTITIPEVWYNDCINISSKHTTLSISTSMMWLKKQKLDSLCVLKRAIRIIHLPYQKNSNSKPVFEYGNGCYIFHFLHGRYAFSWTGRWRKFVFSIS